MDAMMSADDPPDRGQTRELRRSIASFQQQNERSLNVSSA